MLYTAITMIFIFLISLLALRINANYDFGGQKYARQRVDRLVFGVAMIRNFSTMPSVLDEALAAGYRTFDTAQLYGNEEATGSALNNLLPKHKLKRGDIFVSTKISPYNQGDRAEASIIESLNKLNLGYIDLMLIHWPSVRPDNPSNPHHHQIVRKATWKTLEKYYKLGKIKAIGVSNYLPRHLDDLLSYAKVYPAVNQAENSLTYQMNDLVEYCARKDILFEAYSCQLRSDRVARVLNMDQKFTRIAKKYQISTKELEYVYGLNRNMSVVIGASSRVHIWQNRALLNIRMRPEDVTSLTLPIGYVGHKATTCGNDPRLIKY